MRELDKYISLTGAGKPCRHFSKASNVFSMCLFMANSSDPYNITDLVWTITVPVLLTNMCVSLMFWNSFFASHRLHLVFSWYHASSVMEVTKWELNKHLYKHPNLLLLDYKSAFLTSAGVIRSAWDRTAVGSACVLSGAGPSPEANIQTMKKLCSSTCLPRQRWSTRLAAFSVLFCHYLSHYFMPVLMFSFQ